MLSTKGAVLGVAAALAGAALLFAGMTLTGITGAATDLGTDGGGPSGGFELPADFGTTNPPASPVDPPSSTPPGAVPNPVAGTDPNAGGAGPDASAAGLPNAGFGAGDDGNSLGTFVTLLAMAGFALVGVGAAAVAGRRSR
jgi:hypothetical protein